MCLSSSYTKYKKFSLCNPAYRKTHSSESVVGNLKEYFSSYSSGKKITSILDVLPDVLLAQYNATLNQRIKRVLRKNHIPLDDIILLSKLGTNNPFKLDYKDFVHKVTEKPLSEVARVDAKVDVAQDCPLFIVTIKELRHDMAIGIVDEGDLDIAVEFQIALIKKLGLKIEDKFEWRVHFDRDTLPMDCKPVISHNDYTEEENALIDQLLDFSKKRSTSEEESKPDGDHLAQ